MNHEIGDAFSGCSFGSPVIQCACGRMNFAGEADLMDEGELESMQVNAKAAPKAYTEHAGYDTVSGVEFNGAPHVWGCDCQWEERLQRLLDKNQDTFVRYYRQKLERAKKAAAESVAQLESLNGAVAP